MTNRGLLDMPGFNECYDGVWDLVILPGALLSLFSTEWRVVGGLTLGLWTSRAVALYGDKATDATSTG